MIILKYLILHIIYISSDLRPDFSWAKVNPKPALKTVQTLVRSNSGHTSLVNFGAVLNQTQADPTHAHPYLK